MNHGFIAQAPEQLRIEQSSNRKKQLRSIVYCSIEHELNRMNSLHKRLVRAN